MNILDYIREPWPWFVSGTIIALVMFLLVYFGKTFGCSSNFRALCAMAEAGRVAKFFDLNWRAQLWNLTFLGGAVIGGWITSQFLTNGEPVQLSEATVSDLSQLGLAAPQGLQPEEIFNFDFLFTIKGFILFIVGGFLVGFGTAYGGGCTSGHAISGLSDLQLPSLVAVIGFFAGGLVATHFLLPLIFKL